MSVNIPNCSDDAILVPLKLHFGSSPSSSPNVLWAVDFEVPAWDADNYIPPLNTEQHNRIELLAKEKGAQGICQKDGGLFAAFPSEEIAENVYGREIFGDAFAVRTMQYLRGEVDTEEFLADVADASKNDIAEASIVLLGGMESERPSSKKADLYPLSAFKLEIDERKHDSLLHSLFIMIGENPLDDKNWANLALTYFFSGKATEAITAARWAVALNPADSANWKALILVFSASYLAGDRDARFWIERAMAQLEEMDSEEPEAVNLPRRILNYVRGDETINSGTFLAWVAKASEEDRAAVSGLLLQEVQISLETGRRLDLFTESAMHEHTIPLLKGRLNEAKTWTRVAFALSGNGMHALAVTCARWAVALEPAAEQRWEDLAAILFKQYSEEGGSEVLHNREQEARAKAQEIRDKASPKPAKTTTDDTEGKTSTDEAENSSTSPVASGSPQAGNLANRILDYVKGEETIYSEAFLAQLAEASEEDRAVVSALLLRDVKSSWNRWVKSEKGSRTAAERRTGDALATRFALLFTKIEYGLTEAKRWMDVADALSSAGLFTEAVTCARWAVALEPATPGWWDDLAKILLNQYDKEGGSEPLRRAKNAAAKARQIEGMISHKPAKTTTDDTEGSSTPPVASEGPQSTPAPEGGSQTMADVGGFDPSEQDLFSTTSTESATLLYSVTNTTDPNVGIQMVQGSAPTTLGLPTWFAIPAAARSAGITAR